MPLPGRLPGPLPTPSPRPQPALHTQVGLGGTGTAGQWPGQWLPGGVDLDVGLDALGAFRVDGLLESSPRAWASRLSPEQAEGAPARQGVERAPQAVSPLLFRLGGRDGGSGWAQTLASAGQGQHGQGAGSGSHSSSPGALSLFIWGCLRPAPGEGPLTPRTSGSGACSLHSSPASCSLPCPLEQSPPSLPRQAVTALLPLPLALGGSLFLGHKAPLILCSAPSHVTRWAGRGSPESSAADSQLLG